MSIQSWRMMVPQFTGKIKEQFVEWVAGLRTVGGRTQGRDETSPWTTPLQERTPWTAEADHQDNIIETLTNNGYGVTLEEKGQETLNNHFEITQGKTEAIQD